MNNYNPWSLPPLISIDVASQLPIKLTAANYSSWRRQFHSFLVGYGLQGFVDGTITRPPSVASLTYRQWIQQDQRLFHAIMASVEGETVAPLIVSSRSAREAWLTLERLFASKTQSRHMELKDSLSRLSYHVKNQSSVSTFLASLKQIANDLALIDHPVEDDDLVLHALNGVGPEFKEIVSTIRARNTPISFEELFYELVEFEKFLERKDRVVCQYCDELGHSAKTCHCIINQLAQHRFPVFQTATATTNPNGSSSSWLFDSAVTQHITNALRNLSLPQFYDGPNSLINGDGSEINFTKGALTVVVILLQPILLLYKLLFGRTSNILNAAYQQSDANIIPSAASVPPPISNSADPNSQDAPASNNNINTSHQQSNDDGVITASGSSAAMDNSDSVTSKALPKGDYEVFLSFRGPDTRHQFTVFLFQCLESLKIRTFIDDDSLVRGDEIAPSLVKFIEQSKIYIVILSEKYADSKWCLNELAKIVECREQDKRHIILPIFYLVDPSDVKHQTGPYQQAFQQHEKNCDRETVQKWRAALKLVGHLGGWHLKRIDQHRHTIDDVSNNVLMIIRKNNNLIDFGELVGIDDHVKAITEKLSLESPDLTMVGIHGFPGIGKTTIAKAVFHKLGEEFERDCFLENIREKLEDGNDGIISLQKKLISSVMLRKNFVVSINSVDEGRRLIQDRVTQFKVLIVLDDVDEKFKFKDILGDPKNFALGSRFILTSENTKVLSSCSENRCQLYEVKPMDKQLSLQLFCKHAFEGGAPEPGFETLAKKIVKKIRGVPLSLKVVGSSLLGEEKSFWEGTLAELEKIPPKEIIQPLRISYQQLDYEAQQMFLDIACFYIGVSKDIASYMWSDLGLYPETRITRLIQRSLIKIGDNNKFQMHDQLRDMGRAIAREENREHPWMRSRVWNEKEALQLLQNKKGSDEVKALNLEDEYEKGKLTSENFMNLSELRYFEAEGVAFDGDFNNLLPNMRWLRLREHNSENCCPTNFNMRNLLILDLKGSKYLKSDWGGWSQIKTAEKLKFLCLAGCSSLTRLPDFPESGSLEVLDLSNVCGLDPDVELDVGNLRNLKKLSLSNVKLKRISGGTIGTMKRLEDLDLADLECDNLNEVLVDIGELSSLKILATIKPSTYYLQDIDELKPSDIAEILEEKKMEAGNNRKEVILLGKLPTNLKQLRTSSGVVNLSELLELEELVVEDCDSELQIPPAEDSWWKESKLNGMALINTNIVIDASSSSSTPPRLPSSLKVLLIWDCLESEWLPTLENLENLTELGIIRCSYLREIQGLEDLFRFNKLESLQISFCPLLTSTFHQDDDDRESFVNSSLEELCIHSCGGGIPHLSNFPKLVELEIGRIIDDQQGMESQLEPIADLVELEDLKLYELDQVERLPSFSKLQYLTIVAIIDLPRLRQIQGLPECKYLERLVLAGCTGLEALKLPAAKLKLLKELDIRGCHKLPSSDVDALKADYLGRKNVDVQWPDEPYVPGQGIPPSSQLYDDDDSSSST